MKVLLLAACLPVVLVPPTPLPPSSSAPAALHVVNPPPAALPPALWAVHGWKPLLPVLSPPPPPPTFTQLWRLFFSKKLSKTHFYSLEKCIFDDVLEKYCCWLTVCRSCCPHPPPFPPSPSLALPPHLWPWTSTLPPPHFLQPCGLCMGGSLCCQFLALPHPHPPLRTFRGCSFQKNYLKRTFAASKSAFSIMSYESITAGCLFAGRACSTHPPSSPVPPRLRPCTLLTLSPAALPPALWAVHGWKPLLPVLSPPPPPPTFTQLWRLFFSKKNYLKRTFTASKSAFSMMS